MQPKVSMVIPCYNKEKYIGNMFNSIIAQKWDNIELILVNDGSMDGTRDVIAEYETRFRARGFEVIIIDQENKGLPGAVYEGLKRVSGEFVCQVDADDELNPEYVSIMAGWLTEHGEYEWAACDSQDVRKQSTKYISIFPYGCNSEYMIEKWLFSYLRIWIYMVRSTYLSRCNVVALFYTGRETSQEASLFIPLAMGGGKLKCIRKALYKYNLFDSVGQLSDRHSFDSSKRFWGGYLSGTREVILRLPIDTNEKQRLCAVAEVVYRVRIVRDAFSRWENLDDLPKAIADLLEQVKLYFYPFDAINTALSYEKPRQFCNAVRDNILGVLPVGINIPQGRVIAWGALGKRASMVLPTLKGTNFEPTELWDITGDGVTVMKPNPGSLTSDDLVLVLPKNAEEIVRKLEKSSCCTITFAQLASFALFPEFYNGSVKFDPMKNIKEI